MSAKAKIALFGTFGGLLLLIFVGLFANGDDPAAGQESRQDPAAQDGDFKSAYEKGAEQFERIQTNKANQDRKRKEAMDLASEGSGNGLAVRTDGQDGGDPQPKPETAAPDGEKCRYPEGNMMNKPGCIPDSALGKAGPRGLDDCGGGAVREDPSQQARRQMMEQIRQRRSQLFQEAVSSKMSVSSQFAQAGGSGGFDASDPDSIAAERRRAQSESGRLSSLIQPGAQQPGISGGPAPSGDIYGPVPDPNNPSGSISSSAPGAQSYGQMANAGGWSLGSQLETPSSPYMIRAGMVIPATLISGVNSDLPGQITAQVSQNVWDTATGKYLMIPQGTRLVGTYASSVAYGQERVMMAWQRLIFPDGRTLDIGAMPGADMAGFSGGADQVNNHWFKMLGAAFLMSGITAAVSVSVDDNSSSSDDSTNMSDTMRESLATQFGQVIENVIQKNLSISPTLELRPGYRFNVIVTKDMRFKKPYKLFNY